MTPAHRFNPVLRVVLRAMPRPLVVLAAAVVTAFTGATIALAAEPAACTARSGPTVTPVVELYTSEGCSSCPPADRWLSRIAPDADTVALAFHVDYWDRLGWKDRFASAAHTARQGQQQAANGARFSYTPQVVVDGADRKDWPGVRLPLKAQAPSQVQVTLAREGERFVARVEPSTGGPARLAAYWAVTEANHVTSVNAGENEGVTLKHDFVVREYRPVPAWAALVGVPFGLSFTPASAANPLHARQVNLVVVNAGTGRPVQAVKLGC